jgi:hypothetical protein
MRAMPRAIAAAIAAGRALFGIALLIAPGPVAQRWLGSEADRPAAQELLRGIGARDLVLGTGALVNLREGGSPAPWVAAAALADGADAVAAVAVGDGIPKAGRWATIVVAGALAMAGAALARALD